MNDRLPYLLVQVKLDPRVPRTVLGREGLIFLFVYLQKTPQAEELFRSLRLRHETP
ncbi:hypothetical protein SIN01_28070 [Sporolactobacillus inulinus]|nr:hypothetical protein SIN01_28070 [Sporolactobacillus inulinus]